MRYQLYLRNRNRAHLGWSAYASYGLDAAAATTLGCSTTTTRKLLKHANDYARNLSQQLRTTGNPTIAAYSTRTGAEVLAVFYCDAQSGSYAGRDGARRLAAASFVPLRGW